MTTAASHRGTSVRTSKTSSILGTGDIAEIEMRIPSLLGCSYGLALPSATLALRLSLQLLGVGWGDEVIIPAYDWLAADGAVASLFGVSIPVDVQLPDCTIDASQVELAISTRTKAVVATHLAGVPADVDALRRICDRSHVPLIEDVAQAIGATLDGEPVGSFGSCAVLSFGPGKQVDAGGGGMLVTRDLDLWREAVRLSQHPSRQVLSGIEHPNLRVLELRIHPDAARRAREQVDGAHHRLMESASMSALLVDEAEGLGLRTPRIAGRATLVGRAIPVLRPADQFAVAAGFLSRLAPPSGVVIDGGCPRAESAPHRVRLLHPTATSDLNKGAKTNG